MFQIAVDEEVTSHFIYAELADLHRKLGETAKCEKCIALCERMRPAGS